MESGIIRLFVVEDHPVIISGLKNQFRPKRDKIEVTGSASSVTEALKTADPESFDIFILDLWLDHDNPDDGLAKLKEKFPLKPVIIYTSETVISWQRRMMKAGAMAYIIKTARRQEIKSAIELVAAGNTVMPKAISYEDQRKVSFGITNKSQRLTPNQLVIIQMVAAGNTLKEIAESNHTNESTVNKTLNTIRSLFDAKNTAELVSILKDEKII